MKKIKSAVLTGAIAAVCSSTPKQGRLYKPKRNGLYNYSNYQATVT